MTRNWTSAMAVAVALCTASCGAPAGTAEEPVKLPEGARLVGKGDAPEAITKVRMSAHHAKCSPRTASPSGPSMFVPRAFTVNTGGGTVARA